MRTNIKYLYIFYRVKVDKQKHDKFTTMTIMNEFYTGNSMQ